jgi:hypothetical protein
MIIRNAPMVSGIAILLIASPALSETWQIKEGVSGEWSGEWTFSATATGFACTQRAGNTVLLGNCTIIREGNLVAVTKRELTYGNDCNYFGRQDGASISGRYFCKSGGPYNWSATVTKSGYTRTSFGFDGCNLSWGPLQSNVSEADMSRLATDANANGFTYHPLLKYGYVMIGDYPMSCKSPADRSWPLYLR